MNYGASLSSTKQYWFKLISVVDTDSFPTMFFTYSAADLQSPELAHLICPDDSDSRSLRIQLLLTRFSSTES